jgi:hypothetical protein
MYLLAAKTANTFCTSTRQIWSLVGKILGVFKIVIPLLVIIYGMIDLGKAVVASKDDEIKKAAKQLLIRILAGIVIFFIPTIVGFMFGLADGSTGDYDVCAACITNSNGC